MISVCKQNYKYDKAGREARYYYSDLRGILKVKDFAGLETATYYFRRYDVAYNGKIRQYERGSTPCLAVFRT